MAYYVLLFEMYGYQVLHRFQNIFYIIFLKFRRSGGAAYSANFLEEFSFKTLKKKIPHHIKLTTSSVFDTTVFNSERTNRSLDFYNFSNTNPVRI